MKRILAAGLVALAGLVTLGMLALPTATGGASTSTDAKRDDDAQEITLVDDDDDDDTNSRTRASRLLDTRNTRNSRHATNTRGEASDDGPRRVAAGDTHDVSRDDSWSQASQNSGGSASYGDSNG